METIAVVIIVLVCLNLMLKQTFQKTWKVALLALLLALLTAFSWPYAIEQSKTQLASWISDSSLMLDMAAILTVDVAIQMAFSLMAAHIMTSEKLSRRTIFIYKALRLFPGILIFPVLFGCLVALIFALPGKPFALISWSMAAAVLIIIPIGTALIKWLIPEKELRLEILFLTNALTALLAVVATVNGKTAINATVSVDWLPLAAIIALTALCATAGLLIHKNKKIKIKI